VLRILESSWKDEVSTPALIIDYDLMKSNIETMAKFAKENNVNLRPHVKTHKCPTIGKMQLEAGAGGICVARVGEAEVFVNNGFNDILIANEVIELNQIKRLIELNKSALVRVCVDSEKNINDLSSFAAKENITLEVLLELNIGMDRTGVTPGEPALKLANLIKESSNLKLVGLQAYNSYLTRVAEDEGRKSQTEECLKKAIDTRDLLNQNGFDISYITTSGSGEYMFAAKYDGITEIQPGTYVFCDLHLQEVVSDFKIATTVLSTVGNNIAKRKFTMDAGSKAVPQGDGKPSFKNFPKSMIRLMTEEHTQFRAGPKETFEIGQKIELIPAHICITVNLYDFFTVIRDEKVFAKWEILARGKNY
jgi:D-serine deaminase-like pyridoxal phosphate-dependent protein